MARGIYPARKEKRQKALCVFYTWETTRKAPEYRLPAEKDKRTVGSILDWLKYIALPESVDIGPILACTHNEKWQIRHPAISALAKAEHTSAKGADQGDYPTGARGS